MQKPTEIYEGDNTPPLTGSLSPTSDRRASFFSTLFHSWISFFTSFGASPDLRNRVTSHTEPSSAFVSKWQELLEDPERSCYDCFFSFLEEQQELLPIQIHLHLNALFSSPKSDRQNLLPQLAFFALKDFKAFKALCIQEKSLPNLLEKIELSLENKWKEAVRTLETASSFSGSSSYEALTTQYPLAVADFLLLSEGKMLPPFIFYFAKHYLCQNSLQKHIANNLHVLATSSEIQTLLNELETTEKSSTAQIIVRAIVGKEVNTPLIHRDVVLAFLSAFLSNIRQQESGTCFATSLGVFLCQEKPLLFAQDLKDLLKEGGLTRFLGTQKYEFPCLLPIKHKELEKPLKQPFLLHPGFRKLAKALRNDKEEFLRLAIETESAINRPLTAQNILHSLSTLYAEKSEEHKVYLIWTFLSAFQNPLLLCWESSVAEMAEAKERGMVMRPVLHAILRPIEKWLEKEQVSDARQFCSALKTKLSKRVRLLWDPAVFRSFLGEKECLQGGFILYDNDKFSWKRIDNEKLFGEFVTTLCLETSLLTEEQKQKLCLYTASKRFTKDALYHYNPECRNAVEEGRLATEQIPHTPWRTISGNIAENVLKVYFECEELSSIHFSVENAETLLFHLTRFAEERQTEKKRYTTAVSKHAFNTLICFDSSLDLKGICQNPQNYLAQLEECRKLFQGVRFSKEWEQAVLITLKKELPVSLRKNVQMLPLLTSGRNMNNFFQEMKEQLQLRFPQSQTSQLEMALKKSIFSHLPKTCLRWLKKHLLVFADSNWEYEGENLYFAFSYDPFEETLGIYEMTENLSYFFPLLSEELLQTQWTITEIPLQN